MELHEIGENAGRIWQTLKEHGPLDFEKLLKNTGLDIRQAYLAIGWLAREDKLALRQEQKHLVIDLKEDGQ